MNARSRRLDWERLGDIIGASERIERYRERGPGGEDDLDLIRDAVLYNLVIIGEAAGAIDAEVQALAPTVDWRGIRDLRNLLAHAYFRIDMATIWNVVDVRVPLLRANAEELARYLERTM